MACDGTISVTPETVTFVRDEHRQKKSLVIRNDGSNALMFKMKSTLAGALRMRPVHGQVGANASTTIRLELRWNSIVKRICVASNKGRISVVFADAPHSPKPPPIFWRGLKTQKETTTTITKKVQIKVEPPTSYDKVTETTSSDDKPPKLQPAGASSEKPKKTSEAKAGDAAAKPKPATHKPETTPTAPPSTTNDKKPVEEGRAAHIAEQGQATAADTPGVQAQAQGKPGIDKPKEASSEKPPDAVTVSGGKTTAALKAAVGTAKETSDSSSSSSSSSKEEKK